jgi:putative DNA methylase
LEYPQKLAGQTRPLPKFALDSGEFMQAFLKGEGKLSKAQAEKELAKYQLGLFPPPEADLAWHVRAWGWWVLKEARKDLERFYPTIGGKPTVAYLWARTVTCKNCRATIPLLKTRWLCKKDNKRVVLTMEPNVDKTGVCFGVQYDVPILGGNTAQKRENDRKVGLGTMSRSGATCPCCSGIMKGDDIRYEGQAGRLGQVQTVVVFEASSGKDYRLPTEVERKAFDDAMNSVVRLFEDIPFTLPVEPVPRGASRVGGGSAFSIQPFGVKQWHQLFNSRQLLAIGTFIKRTRAANQEMRLHGYKEDWSIAISSMLALAIDRLADRGSTVCSWTVGWDKIRNTFTRFALPYTWDYAESVPIQDSSGGYPGSIEWISMYIYHASQMTSIQPSIRNESALSGRHMNFDLIITDPPYYDAIPYSDLMDFFTFGFDGHCKE